MITRELLQIHSQTFQDHSWNENREYFGEKFSEKNFNQVVKPNFLPVFGPVKGINDIVCCFCFAHWLEHGKLHWFNENLFFVRSTCTSYQRCGSRTDVSRQNTIWNIVKLCCPHKISRNGKVIFGYFLLIRNLFMNTIWSHSSLISFFVINPEDGIFRVWVLNFRK